MALAQDITLSVNPSADGTTYEDQVYSRYDDSYPNRSTYIGPGHLPAEARNLLNFYRTPPKPNGNFKGVKKTALKFTEDEIVDGADGVAQLTAPDICNVEFSFPVGITDARNLAFRQRVAAAILNTTLMDSLTVTQHV